MVRGGLPIPLPPVPFLSGAAALPPDWRRNCRSCARSFWARRSGSPMWTVLRRIPPLPLLPLLPRLPAEVSDLPSAPPMDSSSMFIPMDLVLLPMLPTLLLLADRYDDRRRMDGIRFFFAFFLPSESTGEGGDLLFSSVKSASTSWGANLALALTAPFSEMRPP